MNLYFRLLVLLARLTRLPRAPLLAPSRVRFRALPTDCDVNLHLNNGRYLSFMDLGRVHLMQQVRVAAIAMRERWKPVIAGVEIQFIRPIAPLQRFDLVTRIVTWDEKYVYLEHRFEAGGTLCAHAFAKGLFLAPQGKVDNHLLVTRLGYEDDAPEMPEELEIWAQLGTVKKQKA
jgi:acyl-CoA thioesterase FadM